MSLLCFALAASINFVPRHDGATDLASLLPDEALVVVESTGLADLHAAMRGSSYGALLFGPDGLFVKAAAAAGGLPDGSDAAAVAELFFSPAPTPEQRAAAGNTWAALHDAIQASSGPIQMHVLARPGEEGFSFVVAMHTPGLARQSVEQWLALTGRRSEWWERLGFELAVEPGSAKLDDYKYFLGCREDLVVFVAGSDHGQARREFSRIARGVTSGALSPAVNTNFVAARAALDQRNQVRVLVDLAPLGAWIADSIEGNGGFDSMPPEVRTNLAAMHLADIRFAAFGVHVGAGEVVLAEGALAMPTVGFLAEMMKTLRARPPAALLGRVPKNASSVSVGGIELAQAAGLVRKLIDECGPDFAAELDQQIDDMVAQSGVDFLGVLVDELTGQYVSYMRPTKAAPLGEIGMAQIESAAVLHSMGMDSTTLVEVRDTARLEAGLDAMLAWAEGAMGAPLPIDEIMIDGRRVRGVLTDGSSLWFGFAPGAMVLGIDADAVASDLARGVEPAPVFDERLARALAARASASSVTVWETRALVAMVGRAFGTIGALSGGAMDDSSPVQLDDLAAWLDEASQNFAGTTDFGYELRPGVLHFFTEGH